MYMFIVREVNKSIAKTLTWCHSPSAVIGILALQIEQWVWHFELAILIQNKHRWQANQGN